MKANPITRWSQLCFGALVSLLLWEATTTSLIGQQEDLRAIQGDWQITENYLTDHPNWPALNAERVTIRNRQLSFYLDPTLASDANALRFQIELDANEDRKQIDMLVETDSERRVRWSGTYRIEEKKLILDVDLDVDHQSEHDPVKAHFELVRPPDESP